MDNLHDPYDPNCNNYLLTHLASGAFHAAPFLDTVPDGSGHYPDYGDQDHNIVSLYGAYGNNEKTSTSTAVQAHYAQGKTLASQVVPLCPDGTTTSCTDAEKAIIFLFIGFSNTDIEIGGGNTDVWDNTGDNQNMDPSNHFNGHLYGQPCSTLCENLHNPDGMTAWNQVLLPQTDGYTQQSLLYQVYNSTTPLVGPHVVLFNGAYGQQTLAKWDPGPNGYYSIHGGCTFDHQTSFSPECNYVRVKDDLNRNVYTTTNLHYTEAQVEAVFIKSGDNFPQCDLKQAYWQGTSCSQPSDKDAYQAEVYMGDILRYLKCCENTMYGNPVPVPRYPNLKQVFITSRIYGGWANGNGNGCLNPEPFAYELGFTVQRSIVAQINQTANPPIQGTDPYSGQLDYTVAPWFDWAPYLWADGVNVSPGSQLNWCDWTTRSNNNCLNDNGDVRFGDTDAGWTQYYGDQIHPTGWGTKKVAGQLVKWLLNTLPASQSYLSDWFGYGGTGTPWILQ